MKFKKLRFSTYLVQLEFKYIICNPNPNGKTLAMSKIKTNQKN